ncbi:MAG TPA: alpha/beta hydrolase [Burkholderiaceae bacterium]|nr:alpha/beta hydrolase [Burkholderiaceae bacterium]
MSTAISGMSNGPALLQLAGTPTCGVNVQYFQYGTIDGTLKVGATASGALMIPTGTAAQCQGKRPIVLYAHGTNEYQNYNLANWATASNPASGEGAVIAATYAAQGFIVVAPNYVGYDISNIKYHPYLVGPQQTADMINSLQAARTALPTVPGNSVTDNGQLFITGYSQGGYVALATQRAMEAAAANGDATMTVTAGSPGSGPYALGHFVDFVMGGHPSLGGPVYSTMIATAYQNSYGDIYSQPSDLYTASLASQGIATLLPYVNPTPAQQTIIPELALFSATPPSPAYANITPAVTGTSFDQLYTFGFGDPSLVNNTYRLAFLQDIQANPDNLNPATNLGGPSTTATIPLRKHLAANDLRGYYPKAPTLLCGGQNDPEVYFAQNATVMNAQWAAHNTANPNSAVKYGVLDLAATPSTTDDGYNAFRVGFQALITSTGQTAYNAAIANGATASGAAFAAEIAQVENTHNDEFPFCGAAARQYFSQFVH